MEQTPSSPGRSPELPSVAPPSAGEGIGAFSGSETIKGASIEQEQRGEAVPRAEQSAVASPVMIPTPVVVAQPQADDTTASTGTASDDLPTVAGDDELIEKEWVNKAKKVIAETKDDPYRREQEVSRLQADYLLKRYGRELGSFRSDG